MGVYSAISKWLAKPFDSNGNALNWFLFVGLLLVIIFAWSRVIGLIKE